jgi:hypothetical protein
MLRWPRGERLFEPTLRGCSSVVEHLLAKEDVASSSLVTRSSLRLVRSANRRLERARRSRGEGGPADRIQATAGKPARDFAVVDYPYILQSKSAPNQRYIGLTRDLKKRLLHRQDGRSPILRNSLRGLWSRTSHLSLRTQPWHSRGILNLVRAAPSRRAIFAPIK